MTEPRVAILTFGSRGDVEPFLALALALQREGAVPVLAAHANYRDWIAAEGVEFAELAGDPVEWMRVQARLRAMAKDPRVVGAAARFTREWGPVIRTMLEQSTELVERCDALVFSHGALAGPHLHEAFGKPTAFASLQPWDVTSEHSSVALFDARGATSRVGRSWNQSSHWLGEQLGWFPWRWTVNRWRRERLGLGGVPLLTTPWRRLGGQVVRLYGYSPHAAPAPADWPADRYTGGWWRLGARSDWDPPAELTEFLNDGSAPVYLGFGSHVSHHSPRYIDAMVEEVGRRLGVRFVLSAGWAGLGGSRVSDSGNFLLNEAPHDWLFPRMRAVVHHGGAGTTGAAFHAGVPQVAVPAFFDQFFWSKRIQALGVGARVTSSKLTAEALYRALEQALTPEAEARAAAAAEVMRAEPGAAGAARHLLLRFGLLS